MLNAVDTQWQEYLRNMDTLRQGWACGRMGSATRWWSTRMRLIRCRT